MYICLCHAVTDHQIRQAVQEGVSSLRQMQLCLRVGTNCGKCIPSARQLVKEALTKPNDLPITPAKPSLKLVVSR
jgi:bacterioferritin-associated ferredoxin